MVGTCCPETVDCRLALHSFGCVWALIPGTSMRCTLTHYKSRGIGRYLEANFSPSSSASGLDVTQLVRIASPIDRFYLGR